MQNWYSSHSKAGDVHICMLRYNDGPMYTTSPQVSPLGPFCMWQKQKINVKTEGKTDISIRNLDKSSRLLRQSSVANSGLWCNQHELGVVLATRPPSRIMRPLVGWLSKLAAG